VKAEKPITSDSRTLDLVREWTSTNRANDVPLGCSADRAIMEAAALRRDLKDGRQPAFDSSDSVVAADIFHAACGLLDEDCSNVPEATLEEAARLWRFVNAASWASDETGEKSGLLRFLALICWRAARVLEQSEIADRWERGYVAEFRSSLDWDLIADACTKDVQSSTHYPMGVWRSEDFFAALQYLNTQRDSNPDLLATKGPVIHAAVENSKAVFRGDMRSFLLGFSARLSATGKRLTGGFASAHEWLNRAEEYFRHCDDFSALLARLTYQRLSLLYSLGRLDLVIERAPSLEAEFAMLRMWEDRFRCRIVWAACLKAVGECERALEALEPLRASRSEVGDDLYAWVVYELGDISLINEEYDRGFDDLRLAAQLFRETNQMTAWSTALTTMGFGYRKQGLIPEAIEIYRIAQAQSVARRTKPIEAYIRLLITEAYVASERWQAAEEEILAILPILEAHRMVPESVAAVRFLREARRHQKVDPREIGVNWRRLGWHEE
jgi:tetratricopeptide (TPR) repeat protein